MSQKAAARCGPCGRQQALLDFDLLGDFQRVIHLDSEIPDGTFQPMY
jgi:hypothetical protein